MAGNQALVEFVDQLPSTESFSLSKCQAILNPPVTLVARIGNLCSACYQSMKEDENVGPAISNTLIDHLLPNILFRCPFRWNGCDKKFRYNELNSHKESCHCRTVKCVFNQQCSWQGRSETFINHLRFLHSDKVMNSDNKSNKFTLVIESTRNLDNIVVLNTVISEIFIFRIRLDIKDYKARYLIYDVESKSSKYKFSVKHKGTSSDLVTPCKTVEYTDCEFPDGEGTVLDLKVLHDGELPEKITLVVKIKGEGDNEMVAENMLHHFECPVCKNLMKPPILLCSSGHSLCNSCKPRLERCPTCRAALGNVRNYSLEALTSQIQYHCVYHDQGCEKIGSANQIAIHEASCSQRPYSCVFQGCTFTDKHQSFKAHLTGIHPDKVFTGNRLKFRIPFYYMDRCVRLKRYVMIYGDYIFEVTYVVRSGITHWEIGTHFHQACQGKKEFLCKIELYDSRKPERKIVQSDTCLEGVTDTLKIFSLSNDVVKSFVSNNVIHFRIKIVKKNYDK